MGETVNERALGYAIGLFVWWQSKRITPVVSESTMPISDPPGGYSSKVQTFARAIAYAEGYGTPNAVPTRLHNPGDLKVSSVASVGRDSAGHLQFATADDGWRALYRQIQLIVDGRSPVYNELAQSVGVAHALDVTIAQMATRYAEGSGPWAANVADRLNVTPATRLREVLI